MIFNEHFNLPDSRHSIGTEKGTEMKTSFNKLVLYCLAGLIAFAISSTTNEKVTAQDTDEVTRAYRVDDIVAQVNNYGFAGVHFPALASGGGWGTGAQVGSGAGFGPGGGGGGVFSVPDQLIHDAAFQGLGRGSSGGGLGGSYVWSKGRGAGGFVVPEQDEITAEDIGDTLNSLLEESEPDRWIDGGFRNLGSTLIVTTTPSNHELINEHLKMIRETVSNTNRSVTVLITWLEIDDEKYEMLDAKISDGLLLIDPDKLKAVASEDGSAGSITCFDGQTVHIVSGEMKNWIRSATPVVGALSSESAQQLASIDDPRQPIRLISNRELIQEDSESSSKPSSVGYNPISDTINYGAMLQITPVTIPGEKTAMLDIHSNIVLPMNQPKGTETIDFTESVKLDRLHVRSHQFATSLKVPLGKPVVVGGSTVKLGTGSALYVILEVHAGDE